MFRTSNFTTNRINSVSQQLVYNPINIQYVHVPSSVHFNSDDILL